jgi:hypothetical protein
MKYAVEMGSNAMICIPGFMNVGLGIINLMEWICRQTNGMEFSYT